MKRILMAAFAVPLLAAGTTAALAFDDGTGDYHFHDTIKPHGHKRPVRVLQANAATCMARTGHPNVDSELPAMMHDPAYIGCLARHGWSLYAYTPPKQRSHAHRGYRNDSGPYEPPTATASDDVQRSVDAINKSIDESNAQNAATQP